MKKEVLITAIAGSALALHASIDWNGDTSVTSEGYNTWIIGEAAYAASAPVIDGVASPGEWDNATDNVLAGVFHVTDYEGTMEAQFSAMWDETYLYVLVQATDSIGMADRGHAYEIYVSTGYTRNFGAWQLPGYEANDYQIICPMNPLDTFYSLGLYSDQDPLPSFLRANTVDGASYVSEVRIAWADLGGLPSDVGAVNSDYIGFELHTQRNKIPGGANSTRTKRGWAGIEDVAWASTEDWGTLRLMPAGNGGASWAGYPVSDGWADTESFMGWVYVELAPWIHSDSMGKFIYLPESHVGETGSWAFVPR